jgi:surface protein
MNEYSNNMFWGFNFVDLSDLSGWNTSKVRDISYMFYYCRNLVDASGISNWDTTNIENMKAVFGINEKLEKVDLSHWNTSKVTDMSDMFRSCESLT